MRRRAAAPITRHVFGTPNPIFRAEEQSLLAAVDLGGSWTANAQTIGRNGEIPLRAFLNRFLPHNFQAATGHFVTPSGTLSPQIDVLILDTRYPLLAVNADGSVRAMLHAVIWAIEVKTNLRSRDLPRAWENAAKIMSLAAELEGYGVKAEPVSIRTSVLAYRIAERIDTTTSAFIRSARTDDASLHVTVLRLPEENPSDSSGGVELEFESSRPIRRQIHTPLNDFYYEVVQWSCIILDQRPWSLGDVGSQTSDYMAWATRGEPEYLD